MDEGAVLGVGNIEIEVSWDPFFFAEKELQCDGARNDGTVLSHDVVESCDVGKEWCDAGRVSLF